MQGTGFSDVLDFPNAAILERKGKQLPLAASWQGENCNGYATIVMIRFMRINDLHREISGLPVRRNGLMRRLGVCSKPVR